MRGAKSMGGKRKLIQDRRHLSITVFFVSVGRLESALAAGRVSLKFP